MRLLRVQALFGTLLLSEHQFVDCDTTVSGGNTGWQHSKRNHERLRRHRGRGNFSLDVEHVRDRFLVVAE